MHVRQRRSLQSPQAHLRRCTLASLLMGRDPAWSSSQHGRVEGVDGGRPSKTGAPRTTHVQKGGGQPSNQEALRERLKLAPERSAPDRDRAPSPASRRPTNGAALTASPSRSSLALI
jgi:hypothetical protein